MRIYQAFTLVELLVVIVITSILAAAVLVYLGETKPVARDARRKSDLQTIKQALEKEEFDTGTLTVGAGLSNRQTSGSGAAGTPLYAWNNNFIPKTYIAAVPIDPVNRQYRRIVFNNGGVKGTAMRCMYYRFSSDGLVAAEDKFSYAIKSLHSTTPDIFSGRLSVRLSLYQVPQAVFLPPCGLRRLEVCTL